MSAPSPPHQTFSESLREFYKSHAMFTTIIEQLHQQLSELAAPETQDRTAVAVMQRLSEKAPSSRLKAYLAGKLPPPAPPARNLAEQIDQNLRLLPILESEMQGFSMQLQRLAAEASQRWETRAGNLGAAEEAGLGDITSADTVLLWMAAADGIQREMDIIARLAAAVALDTSPDQLATYAWLLKCKPFLLEERGLAGLEGMPPPAS